jgi:GntP family gluconate:H+ symporter
MPLLLCVLLSVLGLILLISRFKVNAFVALILASVAMGLCAGMPLAAIARSVQEGVGAVLGSVAMVIGLGTVLGKLLAESGGARVVATRLIERMGATRLPWAMLLIAFLIGLPVFFSVGLVLLVPILLTVARQAGLPLMALAIPLLSGLSTAHGLVPPHPGPIVAIGMLGADVGLTVAYSLLVGLPTAVIAGPWLGAWLAHQVPIPASGELADQFTHGSDHATPPGFAVTVGTMLLPVGLMLLAAVVDLALATEHPARQWADFLGHPLVALLVAVLVAFYTFGVARGFSPARIAAFANDCLGPVASVLLVVGAGGGFNRVLIDSGAGPAIAGAAAALPVSVLVLGWLIAAGLRLATGSATVAISTAAGIVAPMAAADPGVNLELLVLAMGAGSLILSHVNDGGFWLVKEYLNLSVPETLRTWTVMETVIAVVALGFIVALDLVV